MKVEISELAEAGIRKLRDDVEFQKSLTSAIKLYLSRIDVVYDCIPMASHPDWPDRKIFFWPFHNCRIIWEGTYDSRLVWSVKPLKENGTSA